MDVLSSLSLADVLLSAAGGFLLSFGAVALGTALPRRGTYRNAPKGKILSAGLGLTLLALAGLLIAFVFLISPWAPKLIAAGLGLLAAPPVYQFAFRTVRESALPAYVALLAAWVAISAFAARL